MDVLCGPLTDGQEVKADGWVKVTGHGKLDPTQFVVRTKGVSIAVEFGSAMSEPFSSEAKVALAELRRTMENG